MRVVQAFRVADDYDADRNSVQSDRSLDHSMRMSYSLMNTRNSGAALQTNHSHDLNAQQSKTVALTQRTSSPTPYPYYHRGHMPPASPTPQSPPPTAPKPAVNLVTKLRGGPTNHAGDVQQSPRGVAKSISLDTPVSIAHV